MVTKKPRSPRTRAILAGALAALTVTMAVSGCVDAAQAAPRHRPASTASTALSVSMKQAIRNGVPGMAVRIDTRKTVTTRAQQARWTHKDGRISSRSQFRMGSNIKPMIATITLQLAQEGRLHLGDTVDRWLPGAVPDGNHITIRELLNHTSGLGDYIGDPRILAKEIGADPRPVDPATLLQVGAENSPIGAPGAQYSYSNTGYIALGLILQKASGSSVNHLLVHRIIRPLRLRDTYLATDGRSRDGKALADGYEPDAQHLAPLLPAGAPAGTAFVGPARGNHVLVTHLDPSWAFSAAGLVSTQADEGRFLRALLSGRLLSPRSLAEMKHTVPEIAGKAHGDRYGLGLERYNSPCGPVWGHTGGVPGYATENYATARGTRSVSIASTTLFGLHDPELGAANQKVVDAAVCSMLGRPSASR